jgi:transglutaminase-like putative cysteine protease
MQYALPHHVFVCLDGEHVVFLNVKQDRYLAVDAAKAAPLSAIVPGWPTLDSASRDSLVDPQAPAPEELARSLAARGLLAEHGKDAAPVRIATPTRSALSEDDDERPRIGIATVAAFVWSALIAHFAVRRWSFERMVRRVEIRNAKPEKPFDLQRVRTLTAAFVYLRPFLFTARDACLFESFAFLEFLRLHGIHARWVFGVQARPFGAHCWVQYEDVVLNDSVERAVSFTPIMVV